MQHSDRDCELCDGWGTVMDHIGPPHNPTPHSEIPCPDCTEAREHAAWLESLDESYLEALAE
jgi:hypothetical protein